MRDLEDVHSRPSAYIGNTGVGLAVINALSELRELHVWRNGKNYFIRYRRGEPESPICDKLGERAKRFLGIDLVTPQAAPTTSIGLSR